MGWMDGETGQISAEDEECGWNQTRMWRIYYSPSSRSSSNNCSRRWDIYHLCLNPFDFSHETYNKHCPAHPPFDITAPSPLIGCLHPFSFQIGITLKVTCLFCGEK